MDTWSELRKKVASPEALKVLWPVLRSVPGGGWMMGSVIGRMAPYTGTIAPEVVDLEPGFARVRMADTPRVRNHLKSVHAIALMNLGEVATGTAVLMGLKPGMRAIIVELRMEYLKKARGLITAEGTAPVPESTEAAELMATADLKNEAGEVVARAHARWKVGPER